MRFRFSNLLLILPLVVLSVGCAKRVLVPMRSQSDQDAQAAWARVLKSRVDTKGRIDFIAIRKDSADLDAYVAYASEVNPIATPDRFPTQEEKTAAYIDLYNSLAMYNAVHSGIRPNQALKFFVFSKFKLGNQEFSLYALEKKFIRPLNEPRVHFALNCMVRGCPRLPQVPWTADQLDKQLEEATLLFFSETPRNVQIDSEKKSVKLSKILKLYTKDFLLESPSLIAFVNRYRAEKIPDDYKVKFLPYDTTLNQK